MSSKPIYKLLEDHKTGSGKLYGSGTRIWVHEWIDSPNEDPTLRTARVSPLNMRLQAPLPLIFTLSAHKVGALVEFC